MVNEIDEPVRLQHFKLMESFLIFVEELLSNPNILPTLRYLTTLTKRICKKGWKMLYRKYVSDLNL